MTTFLLTEIKELMTLEPLAFSGRIASVTPNDLGLLTDAWLAIKDGLIQAVGSGAAPLPYRDYPRRSLQGALVMPGLVDAHTHPIFAGNRSHEFAQRLMGVTYQEIAAKGGGILSTVRSTRDASDFQLHALLLSRLQGFLRRGITTVEMKSGYGLSIAAELKLLRILKAAQKSTPQTLSVTCLALHAKSPEYDSLQDYVTACCEELLPQVASEHLADWVDAFIDDGYFSVADVEPYVTTAKRLGLGLRLHADEFCDVGAAAAAASWGAASADHLQFASPDGIAKLAKAGTVAVLLPGTSLYTRIPFADGKRFYDAGVALAIATDFNPGSCQIDNLPMLAAVAALHNGVPPAAALAGVTYVAAHALNLQTSKGALVAGYDADLVIHECGGWQQWLGDFGRTAPAQVWIKGTQVL